MSKKSLKDLNSMNMAAWTVHGATCHYFVTFYRLTVNILTEEITRRPSFLVVSYCPCVGRDDMIIHPPLVFFNFYIITACCCTKTPRCLLNSCSWSWESVFHDPDYESSAGPQVPPWPWCTAAHHRCRRVWWWSTLPDTLCDVDTVSQSLHFVLWFF